MATDLISAANKKPEPKNKFGFVPDSAQKNKFGFVPDKSNKFGFVPDKENKFGFVPDKSAKRPRLNPDTKNETFEFTEALKQFGIGFGDEALLGFALGAVKRNDGQEFVDAMTSENQAERIARGVGRTVGVFTPVPTKIFKIGQIGGKIAHTAFAASKGGKAVKTALKASVGVKNANKIGRFAARAAEGAGAAGLYGLAVAPEDTVKEKIVTVPTAALFGAGVGVGVEAVRPIFEKIINKGAPAGLKGGTPLMDKLLQKDKDLEPLVKETAKMRMTRAGRTLKAEVIDANSPIRYFKSMIEDVTGKKASVYNDPNFKLDKMMGINSVIEHRLGKLKEILMPVQRQKEIVFKIMELQRYIERADRGIKNPGGWTSVQAKNALLEVRSQLGNTLYRDLESRGQRIRDELLTPMLREARDIFGDKGVKSMLKKGQSYTPFEMLDYLEKNIDKLPVRGHVLKAARTANFKPVKGAREEQVVGDVGDSLVRYIVNNSRFIEGQKVRSSIVGLRKLGGGAEAFIRPGKEGKAVAEGMERISVIKNGRKELWEIPKDVAAAINGMNEQTVDVMSRMSGALTRVLKFTATSGNLLFAPRNIPRDFLQASFTARGGRLGFTPIDLAKGFAHAVRKGELYEQWVKNGGKFSTQTSVINFRKPGSINEVVPSLSRRVIDTMNPLELIQKITNISEEATRLGLYSRALRKGISVPEAISIARNGAIDFNKMGRTMKTLNLWVPFLAARTKGSFNIAEAFAKNPKQAALRASYLVGIPTLATFLHNTLNHPEIYKDIRRFEKDNDFIFIYGKGFEVENGTKRYTDIVKIPKGDVGKALGNVFENFLDDLHGFDPMSAQEIATQTLSDILPIDFARGGQPSMASVLSSASPPFVKAPFEAFTNKNVFTERDIVPRNLLKAAPEEQFTNDTSAIARALGDVMNVSPLIIENTVGTMMGGLGRQILDPTQLPKGLKKSFSGAFGNEIRSQMFEIAQEVEQESAGESANTSRLVDASLEDIKDVPRDRDSLRAFMERFEGNPKARKKFLEGVLAEQRGEDPLIRRLKSMRSLDRLKFIRETSNIMNNDERNEFMRLLIVNKVITPDVIKRAATQ